MTWWFLLLYLGAQLALGLWVSRRVNSERDFFVAGRRLGLPLLSISLFATWFGAETCLGSSGAIYEQGLSGGRADPLGYSLCLLLMGLLLVRRLWRGDYLTLADLFRERFGPTVEKLGVLVLVPSSLIWAAAQVRAFGQVIAATMSVDVTAAVYCSAAFVVVYTFLGGLLGDVITDFVQGILLAGGLLLLLAAGLNRFDSLADAFQAVPPERLRLLPQDESAWVQLDRWSVPIFGSLVAQELIARVLSARSACVARQASFCACAIYLLVGCVPVVLGLLGPMLLPGLGEPEQLLPTLAESLLPPTLFALFSCALLSAILSTVDSILLAASALLAHNVVVPALKLKSQRAKLLTARIMVVLAGAFALVVALHTASVYALVETASAFGTAGVLVVTLAGLYLRQGGARAASSALLAGLVAMPLFEYALDWPAPFLSSVLLACLAYATWVLIGERALAGAPLSSSGA